MRNDTNVWSVLFTNPKTLIQGEVFVIGLEQADILADKLEKSGFNVSTSLDAETVDASDNTVNAIVTAYGKLLEQGK